MTKPLIEAEIPTLIEAWQSAHDDLLALVQGLDDGEWTRPTECPGWTVADIVAHVIDLESVIAGDAVADHTPDWDALPHVTHDFGRLTEVGVDIRRGRPQDEIVDELANVMSRRGAQLREGPQEIGAEVQGPFGPAPLERVLRMRTFDTWVHEQDIRRAIGRPGGLDSPGAAATAGQLLQAFPFLWGKKAAAPVEALLRIEIDGPGIEGSWRFVIDDEGRAVFTDSLDEPDVQLSASWPDLVAVMCGRIDADDAASLSVVALPESSARAEALVAALAITP